MFRKVSFVHCVLSRGRQQPSSCIRPPAAPVQPQRHYRSRGRSVVSRRSLVCSAVACTLSACIRPAMCAEDEPGNVERKIRLWPTSAMKAAFADGMATGMQDYELAVRDRKKALFDQFKNSGVKRILDIGIGAGPNLPYLPSNVTCVGLDPNEFMDKYALRKAASLSNRGIELEMKRGIAEDLPFRDAEFDAVISTLTLCSVRSPKRTISEIQRVLVPGGKFVFVEHVHAKDSPGLQLAQTVLNPLQVLLADGCNLNRDIASLIREHGTSFESVEVDDFTVDLGFAGALISRQVSGTAIKRA